MIKIRHATLAEKQKTYEWLCLSNTANMHMGEPDYPESPIPDQKQFNEDFEDFYYMENGNLGSVMIMENDKEEIGCLCYACFHLKNNYAELDIWMKDLKYCGKGFGPEALKQLIKYLKVNLGIERMIIRPSEKNINAIKAYEKIGFKRTIDKLKTIEDYLRPEYIEKLGPGDYGFNQTAVLTLDCN
jgi:diamine N-acetyltransferase